MCHYTLLFGQKGNRRANLLNHIPYPFERICFFCAVGVFKNGAPVLVYANESGSYGALCGHFFYRHVCRGIRGNLNEFVPLPQPVEVLGVFFVQLWVESILQFPVCRKNVAQQLLQFFLSAKKILSGRGFQQQGCRVGCI